MRLVHPLTASLVAFLIATLAAAQPPNLWPNPSFEQGTPQQLPGWEAPARTCQVAFDTESFHGGSRSLKVTGRTGNAPFYSVPVPIDPRRTYFFSYWMRRDADSSVVLVQCDAAGRPIDDAHRLTCKPFMRNEIRYWIRQSRIITPGDLDLNARSLRASIDLRDTTMWLDDFALSTIGLHDLPETGATYDARTSRFYRERQVLLHASFDRGHDVLDADYAAGDPHVVQRGRPPLAGLKLEPGVKGFAAHFTTGDTSFAYPGPRNFRHNQGTIAFWICGNWNRLDTDPFAGRTILTITANEGYQTQNNDILEILGGRPREPIRCSITGYDWQEHGVLDTAGATVASAARWQPGEWHHLALTWTRGGGLAAFVDGELIAQRRKPRVRAAAIVPNLILLGNRARAPAPDMLIDELIIFSQPFTPDQIAVLADPKRGLDALPPVAPVSEPDLDAVRAAKVREYGLASLDGLPVIGPASGADAGALIRIVPIARATDRWKGFRFTHVAADGKRYTRTFTREPKSEIYLNLLRPEPVNALMVMGDIKELSIHAGDQLTDPLVRSAKNTVFVRWTGEPFEAARVLLHKSLDSRLNQSVLLNVKPETRAPTSTASQILHIASPDKADDDPTLRQHIARYCADPDRIVLGLHDAAQGGGEVALEPMQALHLITRPLPTVLPLTAFELVLRLQCPADRTALSIRLRDPIYPLRTLADVYLCLTGARDGRYRLIIDHPDTIVMPGRRLWWELTFRDGATLVTDGPEGSHILVPPASPREVRQAHVPALLQRALEIYSADSEPHQWDGESPDNYDRPFRELFDCIREVLRLDPANEVARAMWLRIRNLPADVDIAEYLPGDDTAPEWARLQTAVLEQTRQVVHAWCDRQGPDGRFSDNFGDDAELPAQWPYYPLITGDEKSVVAMERSADAYWYHPRLKNGYINEPQDAIHNAEYTPVAECPLLFTRYGDPFHVERLMTIAANMPRWMGRSDIGHLHFRSSWVMADGKIDVSNRHNYDEGACARIAAPTWCVAYYNNNPTAKQIIIDWSRAWVEDFLAERDGKPANTFPARIYFPEDRFEGHHIGRHCRWIAEIMYDSYLLSGDEVFLQDYGRKGSPEFYAKLQGQWIGREQRDRYVEVLTQLLQRISWEKHLYIHADPSTDRVYLPTTMLDQMTVGGFGAPDEGRLVTRIAASYEGTGLDVAPLVLEDTDEYLLLALYNFAAETRDIGVRVWELKPGMYELTIGPDDDRDDRIDRPARTDRITVRRYTRVPVSVPPKRLFLVELKLREAHELPDLLPDPALSLRTTSYDTAKKTLRVTVHNIGSAQARDVRVIVEDAQGNQVATKTIAAIDAPLDLKPRRKLITFPISQKPSRIRLQFTGPEITDVNNTITIH